MKLASFLALLFLSSFVLAEPPKVSEEKLPEPPPIAFKFSVKAGDILSLSTQTEGGGNWDCISKLPYTLLKRDGGGAYFNCPAATPTGTEFILLCSNKDGVTRVLVTVAPPGPAPQPPDVPTPEVDKALVEKLQKAYDSDNVLSAALKPKAFDLLIELYRQAQAKCDSTSLDSIMSLAETVADSGAFLMKGFVEENKLNLETKKVLTQVRMTIAEEMTAAFPNDGPLNEATRKDAKAKYKRIFDALSAVKH